jgi:hypothetical protein
MLTPGRKDKKQSETAGHGQPVPVHRRSEIALPSVFILAA